MNLSRQLETAAVSAHAAGLSWSQFWQANGAAVCRAEPWDRLAYRRLVNRLMALLVAGNVDGQEPVDDGLDMPWEQDDAQASPHDSTTQARCLWPLRQLPMAFAQEAMP